MHKLEGFVLIVEDDVSIRRGLRTTLSALNFEIGEASTGEEALTRLRMVDYDAVLMDLNMPGMGGVEACRRIRKEHPLIPILVVTVRDAEQDKIEALDMGADDYVTKPFQILELAARIRAAVRRKHTPAAEEQASIYVGVFELALEQRRLSKRGENIALTPTEFSLVSVLMKNAGRPVSHTALLTTVWGAEYRDHREYLRTFIVQLRKKIEDDPSEPCHLKTVNYFGYAFVTPSGT